MLECRELVPDTYIDSRDYQALLKILDILMNNIKSDNIHIIDAINPDKCPDHMLPLLASYVGYNYDYNESYDSNRIIIKNYPSLIRNRGNETGISLAAALSVNISEKFESVEDLSMFHMYYDPENGDIKIFYPSYLSKLRDLIEIVRPAGVKCVLIPAESIKSNEQIRINDFAEVIKHKYDEQVSSTVYITTKNRDGNNDVGRGITYTIKFNEYGEIDPECIDNNGYIIPPVLDPPVSSIYRIVGIEVIYPDGSGGNIIKSIANFSERQTNEIIYQITIKNMYTGRVFDIRTDRFKVGKRARVGFGEVYKDE